ncbi:hypothetical protein F6J85_15345 [Microbacterium lushaniae]|uniref:Uncharacterized protein n=1 Tax=Microbacterium lushaniae TaxID=2614639 RepID=A0A5J6L6M6_9MICO|nr:hypothetical protein F6J85_15345 [Microbacterium lushaniae]
MWVMYEGGNSATPVIIGHVREPSLITAVELGAELGHDDGQRPGRRVRQYLRRRYPDHKPNSRWLLTAEQANDVREHFRAR